MFRNSMLGLGAVLMVALAGGIASAQETAGETDVTNAIVNPAAIYLLKEQESVDPANTVLKVQEASATSVSTSGNLNRVAEYRPLENTVRLRKLYFQRALESGVVSLEGDTESTDDRRAVARYTDPSFGSVELRDTRVLHRLEHDVKGIDQDFGPGDQYVTKWERIEAAGALNLPGIPDVKLLATVDNQTRAGSKQHTFYQLHRFNCTDCHTYSASRGLNQETRGYTAGVEATPADRTLISARVGSSYFDDDSTVLTFNFGGPFGNSPVVGNLHSRDLMQFYTAATGGEDYRIATQFTGIDRRNQTTGNSLTGRWFTAHGAWQPSDQVQVMGGYLSEEQSRSLASNLSYNRSHLFMEVGWMPVPEAYASARMGQSETRYSMVGTAAPNYKDRYYELRAGFRPDPSVRLKARLRADELDNPFFPTDPTSRTLLEASASWTPLPVALGIDYRNMREAGPIFATSEETGTAWLTMVTDDGYGVDATYSVTDVDSNSAASYFLDDPFGRVLPLQTGYPYTATLRTFTAGLQLPLGESGFRLRPYYRRTASNSEALLLPIFPSIPADSQLNLVEETTALRLDLPPWNDMRFGIGWEQQQWRDLNNSANDGTFDLWMFNWSTRY